MHLTMKGYLCHCAVFAAVFIAVISSKEASPVSIPIFSEFIKLILEKDNENCHIVLLNRAENILSLSNHDIPEKLEENILHPYPLIKLTISKDTKVSNLQYRFLKSHCFLFLVEIDAHLPEDSGTFNHTIDFILNLMRPGSVNRGKYIFFSYDWNTGVPSPRVITNTRLQFFREKIELVNLKKPKEILAYSYCSHCSKKVILVGSFATSKKLRLYKGTIFTDFSRNLHQQTIYIMEQKYGWLIPAQIKESLNKVAQHHSDAKMLMEILNRMNMSLGIPSLEMLSAIPEIFNGYTKFIEDAKFAIGFGFRAIDPKILSRIEMTIPYEEQRISFLIRKKHRKFELYGFPERIQFGIIVNLILLSVLITLFDERNMANQKPLSKWSLFLSWIFYHIRMMCLQVPHKKLGHLRSFTKIILFSAWVLSIINASIYKISLTQKLTLPDLTPERLTLKDFISLNIQNTGTNKYWRGGLLAENSVVDQLVDVASHDNQSESHLDVLQSKRLIKFDNPYDCAYTALKQENFACISYESILALITPILPDKLINKMVVQPSELPTLHEYLAVHKDFPYIESINRGIYSLTESGIRKHWANVMSTKLREELVTYGRHTKQALEILNHGTSNQEDVTKEAFIIASFHYGKLTSLFALIALTLEWILFYLDAIKRLVSRMWNRQIWRNKYMP